MVTRIIQPVAALKNVVQYFWTFQVNELPVKNFVIKTFVDDSTGIIFHHNEGKSVLRKDGLEIPASLIYGQTTFPTTTSVLAPFSCIGALFYPTAINRLFGVDSHYLTDRVFSLGEFNREANLSDRIFNENDTEKRIVFFSEFIISKLHQREEDKLVAHAIQLVKRNEVTRVRDMLSYFTISERQLERRFAIAVGVSPRHYIQTSRFQRVINFIRHHQNLKLSDIAYELNFSDQPHFTRLIRKILRS